MTNEESLIIFIQIGDSDSLLVAQDLAMEMNVGLPIRTLNDQIFTGERGRSSDYENVWQSSTTGKSGVVRGVTGYQGSIANIDWLGIRRLARDRIARTGLLSGYCCYTKRLPGEL